jgi:hypothetical protein
MYLLRRKPFREEVKHGDKPVKIRSGVRRSRLSSRSTDPQIYIELMMVEAADEATASSSPSKASNLNAQQL